MKFIFFILLLSPMALFAQEQNLEERVKALERKLTEMQADQQLNVMTFHGQLTSVYDDISIHEHYPKTYDNSGLTYLRLRFSLDMLADLEPQFKVYAKFTTTKFFNRWNAEGKEPVANDLEAPFGYKGPTIFLEKAYFDYLPCPDLTLSVGRLPTTEGGPSHLWDNQPRQGTYPIMNFNLPLDGVGLTYRFDRYLQEGHQLALRVLYTPVSFLNFGDGTDPYLNPPREDYSGTTPTGGPVKTTIPVGAAQVDYLMPQNSLSNRSNYILQATLVPNFPLPSGLGTSNARYTAQNTTLYFELIGIRDSSFDASGTATYTSIDGSGFFLPGVGIGSNTDQSHAYGHGLLLDARYRWKTWAVGAEWSENSRQFFGFYTADEDLLLFYRAPGWGQHFYISHKLSNYLTLRVGYRQKEMTNYFLGVGEPPNTDRETRNYYVRLRADF